MRWRFALSPREYFANTAAAKEIREAIEGKAPQRLDMVGMEKQEIEIVLTQDDPVISADREQEFFLKRLTKFVEETGDEELMKTAATLALLIKREKTVVKPA